MTSGRQSRPPSPPSLCLLSHHSITSYHKGVTTCCWPGSVDSLTGQSYYCCPQIASLPVLHNHYQRSSWSMRHMHTIWSWCDDRPNHFKATNTLSNWRQVMMISGHKGLPRGRGFSSVPPEWWGLIDFASLDERGTPPCPHSAQWRVQTIKRVWFDPHSSRWDSLDSSNCNHYLISLTE